MDRRRAIRLTPEEQREFLASQRTIILATHDRRGYPHVVAMWYVVIDGRVHMTTYRRSQKAVNLRRDPRCTLLLESGERYDELKGLMIRGRAELDEDPEVVARVLAAVHRKQIGALAPGTDEALRAAAHKRVVIRVIPERIASWDHSKLGGSA